MYQKFTFFIIILFTILSCGKKELILLQNSNTAQQGLEQYQIGPIWNRSIVKESSHSFYPNSIKRLIKNSGKITVINPLQRTLNMITGTAIYVGKHSNNEFLFATSSHIFENAFSCNTFFSPSVDIKFFNNKKNFKCKRIIYTGKSIDLAIFSIYIEDIDDLYFFNSMLPYSFYQRRYVTYDKEKIMTAGYGHFKNSSGALTIINSFCYDYPKFKVKKINYTKSKNQIKYSVYSKVTDCNISSGDSGSAAIDYQTGELKGIFWASSSQKPLKMKSKSYLENILNITSQYIWRDFSYYVPIEQIARILTNYVNNYKRSDLNTALLKSKVIEQMLIRMKRNN